MLGRFLGGLIIAWLGYLAVPLGMAVGSVMPWVDPETVGPQKLAYYAWPFLVFAHSQHLPDQRRPVRARDRAALDDGRLYRRRRCW